MTANFTITHQRTNLEAKPSNINCNQSLCTNPSCCSPTSCRSHPGYICYKDEVSDIVNLKSPVINLAQKQVKIFLQENPENASVDSLNRCSCMQTPFSKKFLILGGSFGSLLLLTAGAYIGGSLCSRDTHQTMCKQTNPFFIFLLNRMFPNYLNGLDNDLNTYF